MEEILVRMSGQIIAFLCLQATFKLKPQKNNNNNDTDSNDNNNNNNNNLTIKTSDRTLLIITL